jgi:RNA 2',3'-cyclic 3'-phosphodiesterase
MRLFIAIEIPQDIRASIASRLQEFRAIAQQIRWVRAENLHITLKFLGETDANKLGAIEHTLAQIKSAVPVAISLHMPAFIIHAKAPSIIWIGINPSSILQALVSEIEIRMHTLGFRKEERIFVPHLTLARVPRSGPPRKVAPFSEELIETIRNSPTEIGGFSTGEFHLIESKLKSTGAEYTTLHSFPFAAEA